MILLTKCLHGNPVSALELIMARINLTAGRVREFRTDKTQAFLWDAVSPGLAVRATSPGIRNPEGNKAFIFQGKLASGQDVRVTIGDTRTWGIDKAREETRRLQMLIDQGIDPRQHKKEQAASAEAKRVEERRIGETVGDAWLVYCEARRGKWGDRTLLDHQKLVQLGGQPKSRGRKKGESCETVPGPLASLLPLELADLTPEVVGAWLQKESESRPTQAGLAFRLLRAFVNWAAANPAYQVNAEACGRRIGKEYLAKKGAKDDCLQREQVALWFKHVNELGNPIHAAYLQTILLTGARREEVAILCWNDVDFQWKSLTIRDKVEGERTIPLTPYVSLLLGNLPRINDWVFASPTAASGRLMEPRVSHNKALRAAGLPALSIHGLRRSFGTLSEWCEVPVGVVAQIMGHKPSATAEKHYRVRPLDLLRMWHTRIETWILEQAGIEPPKEDEKPGLLAVPR